MLFNIKRWATDRWLIQHSHLHTGPDTLQEICYFCPRRQMIKLVQGFVKRS